MWRKAGAGVFREGSGVQEVFHGSPAMEMKSQFRSQTEFQSVAGLCGEPGLALCAPQMFPPPEKGCCCTWEEMGPVLWNALVLYVGVGLKKKDKFHALESSTENNSLQLKQWKVCSG